jgi:hypothetical protein
MDLPIRPWPSYRGNDDHHINLAIFLSPTSARLRHPLGQRPRRLESGPVVIATQVVELTSGQRADATLRCSVLTVREPLRSCVSDGTAADDDGVNERDYDPPVALLPKEHSDTVKSLAGFPNTWVRRQRDSGHPSRASVSNV